MPQISTNVPKISTNVPQIATNVLQIATNVPQISTNVPQIATNVIQISANVLQIATNLTNVLNCIYIKVKSTGIPWQAEVALGVPGRLRPRIISKFGTTRVVGRQPYAPTAFIPGEIPGTHFQRLSRPQGTWFCQKGPRKKSPATPPGIDPGTVRLVAQRLNHYALHLYTFSFHYRYFYCTWCTDK